MKTTAMGRLLRGTLGGGQARVLMCDTTAMAQLARDTHHASRVCTAAMGRGISASALLFASAEEPANSMTITFKGNGPAGALVTVTRGRRIKAYIDRPEVELPLRQDGKLDVGGAIGHEGRITVVRDLGMREPYIGQCPLQSGEIAEDVAFYCTLSEQQPTLCALGVLVGERVLASGGLMVQPLPGCDEGLLSQLELRAPVYQDISAHLTERPLDDLFFNFFRDLKPELLETEALSYGCDCNRARMERVLVSLGKEELTDMIETQHGAEITCHFCRNAHQFSEGELRDLLAQAQS